MKRKAVGLLVTTFFLGGCTQLVQTLEKGDKKYDPKRENKFYNSTLSVEMDVKLDNQPLMRVDFDQAQRHLDVLVLRGAQKCFPAIVDELKTREKRINHEIYAGLKYDASNDLIVQRHKLEVLQKNLEDVLASGACVPNGNLYERKGKPIKILRPKPVKKPKPKPIPVAKPKPPAEPNMDDILAKVRMLLNSDNMFAFDSEKVNPKYKRRLIEATAILKKYPHIHLQSIGHTDKKGSNPYNVELSRKRAQEVALFLEQAGVSPMRMSVTERASTNPYESGEGDEYRLANRRVDVKVWLNKGVIHQPPEDIHKEAKVSSGPEKVEG